MRSLPAKVLFAIPSMGSGGSEMVMSTLLRNIDTSRFEPHLVVLKAQGDRLKDVPSEVEVHEIGGRSRTAALALARLCWKLRPAAVLSTSAHLNFAVIAARNLLPRTIKFLTREGADIHSPEFRTGRARLFVYKLVYRHADVVVCQSEHMRKNLIHKYGLAEAKVVTIYNPVDTERVARLASSEPNPFTEPGVNIVGVGRFSHEKGFDVLLRCMAMIREGMPEAKLTLVGDGPNLEELRKLRHELGLDGCVTFVGRRQNPYPFIKNASLLLLPSRTEALPNVVLEAIALGTSVVASKCTPALEEIASCTRLMRVAEDLSPNALAADALCILLSSRAKKNSVPEASFLARFGVRTVTEQYEHILSIRRS